MTKCIFCGKKATHYAISAGGRVRSETPLCDIHAKLHPTGRMPIDLWHETMLKDFSAIFDPSTLKVEAEG